MLMLNISCPVISALIAMTYSNTTYVNVKPKMKNKHLFEQFNSNTTYVNVKLGLQEVHFLNFHQFKYNLC